MNFIKVFASLLLMTLISFSVTAQCNVSTSCGSYVFDQCNSLSVVEESVNGGTSVTITIDGVVVVQETCPGGNDGEPGEPGQPGQPGNNDFDICDFVDCDALCDFFALFGVSLPFCE